MAASLEPGFWTMHVEANTGKVFKFNPALNESRWLTAQELHYFHALQAQQAQQQATAAAAGSASSSSSGASDSAAAAAAAASARAEAKRKIIEAAAAEDAARKRAQRQRFVDPASALISGAVARKHSLRPDTAARWAAGARCGPKLLAAPLLA